MKTVIPASIAVAIVIATGVCLWRASRDTDHESPDTNPRAGEVSAIASSQTDSLESSAPPADPRPDQSTVVARDTGGEGADEKEGGRIIGQVVDPAGEPVPDSDVCLALHPKKSQRFDVLKDDYWQHGACFWLSSDEEGEFHFEGIEEGASLSLVALHGELGSNRKLIRMERPEGEDGDTDPTPLEKKVTLTLGERFGVWGTVFTEAEQPMTDGVVSIYQAWNRDGLVSSDVFSSTEKDGTFALSVHPGATHATLQVSSGSQGQQFFREVARRDGPLVLRFRPPASLRGRILWADGLPAAGTQVYVTTTVPWPRSVPENTGRIPYAETMAVVDVHGHYEIHPLPPDFYYSAFVFDPSAGTGKPLTPRHENRFQIKSGETKEWNQTITLGMTIGGKVVTAGNRTPVPGITIGVSKDGKPLYTVRVETDREGRYEIELTSGPGSYRLTPTPESSWDAMTDLIAERFGKTLELGGGEELEMDLEVFDPIRIPFRVIGEDGSTPRSVSYHVGVQLPGGKRFGQGNSCRLDEEGRHELEIFHPVKQFQLEFHSFPRGPTVKTRKMAVEVGSVLPEILIELPATGALTGTLLSKVGEPYRNLWARFRAVYEDDGDGAYKKIEYLSAKIGENGRFHLKGQLRAAPVKVRIEVRGREGSWQSELLVPQPGQELELGEIRISE